MAAEDNHIILEMNIPQGSSSQNCNAEEIVDNTQSKLTESMARQGLNLERCGVEKKLTVKLKVTSIDSSEIDKSEEAVRQLIARVEEEMRAAGSLPEGWSIRVPDKHDSGYDSDDARNSGARDAVLPEDLPQMKASKDAIFGSHKNTHPLMRSQHLADIHTGLDTVQSKMASRELGDTVPKEIVQDLKNLRGSANNFLEEAEDCGYGIPAPIIIEEARTSDSDC